MALPTKRLWGLVPSGIYRTDGLDLKAFVARLSFFTTEKLLSRDLRERHGLLRLFHLPACRQKPDNC